MKFNTIKALVYREFWEHRGLLFRTPLTISLILVLLAAIGTFQAVKFSPISIENGGFEYRHSDGSNIKINPGEDDEWNLQEKIKEFTEQSDKETSKIKFIPAGALISVAMLLGVILSLYYLSQSLYQDRKDKSILFWRSLPNSEWEVVTSKLITAMLLFPISFAGFSIIAGLASLMITYIGAWFLGVAPLMHAVVFDIDIHFILRFFVLLGAALVLILSTLPIYSWFLFSSAFSRKSPLLMAIGIPIAIHIAELVVLHSAILYTLIYSYLFKVTKNIEFIFTGQLAQVDWSIYIFILLVTGVLLVATNWLRNNRYEI